MISTHILDTTLGKPAAGVTVHLAMEVSGKWTPIGHEKTNADGRVTFTCEPKAGAYRLTFGVEDYFKSTGRDYFFRNTNVEFAIHDTHRKYHVPLLLNPFGYSTYRGS